MSLGMDVIQQSPFMPLTKALYEAIKTMNENKEIVTQESIEKFLRQNYQDVHIPSMNIIYDCLGLLIKERMVYHTGNGYFINNRTTETTDTTTHTNNTGNKDKETAATAKTKPVKDSSGSSRHSKHEKSNLKSGQKTSKQTKLLNNANEKAFDKIPNKTAESSVVPSDNQTRRETDSQQGGDDSRKRDPSPSSFTSEKPEEETKKRTEVRDNSANTFLPGDDGRMKRGLLERMSGRKSKTEKEKMNQENSKGPKEKKSVLNQLAFLIKNRSFTNSTSNESSTSSTANSVASNVAQPVASEQTCDQLNQSHPSYDGNDSSVNEETLARNVPEHKQEDRLVIGDKNSEEDEKERPVFTRSRSFVTASRKRQNQVARRNSFANSKPNQEIEQLTTTKVDNTNFATTTRYVPEHNQEDRLVVGDKINEENEKEIPVFTRSRSLVTARRKRQNEVERSNSFANSKPNQETEQLTATKLGNPNFSTTTNFVSASNKGPCAVGIVRPLSQHLESHRRPIQGSPHSVSSSGRSSSFREKVRPRSVPFPVKLSGDTRGKFSNGIRELGRSKSFVSTQKERSALAEKTALAMNTNFRHRVLSQQNSNAYSNSRTSTHGPRVRTLAVPIKNKYGHAPNLPPKKISPRVTTPPKKTSLVDIGSSVTARRNVGHVQFNDSHCTSPICNDRCRINEMKPLNCKCHEYEAESASENSSELNHVLLGPLDHVLRSDINHLAEGPGSLDICLDEVSSTSESVFPAEMKLQEKEFVFDYSRPNTGQSDQTQQCNSYQFAPEEAKTNSSLTFIGII